MSLRRHERLIHQGHRRNSEEGSGIKEERPRSAGWACRWGMLSPSPRPPAPREGTERPGREGERAIAGPLNDSLLSEAPYAGSCLPIGSFFSGCWLRKLAQFSSPAPQLVSTPHLTWQRPLLCGARREGRGDPGVVGHESEADPLAFRWPSEKGKGEREQRCPIKCTFIADAG